MLRLIFKIAAIVNSLIQTLIIFRLVLSIIGANMSNTYVEWVYTMSDIFISPFQGIAPSVIVIDKFELFITPVIALVFFSIIGFVLSEILKTLRRD